MNKLGKLSNKGAIGIGLIFTGLIVASQKSLIVGVIMMGIGLFLVLRE